jgi:hypothetical protein
MISRRENQPNGDKMSDPGSNNEGSTDHIFDVLKTYQHPFILVGATAHRWMGCAGCAGEGFDIVIRSAQLKSIVTDIIETGHWTIFDSKTEWEIFESEIYHKTPEIHNVRERKVLLDYCCDADAVLRSVDFQGGFEYLRLWSEDTYRINIDQGSFVEVPTLHAWNCLLVEEEHHPAIQRDDSWWYGPYILSKADDRHPICIPDLLPPAKGLTNSSPIFIPRIPSYLDALVHHKTLYKDSKPGLSSIADWQIRNLTRYLYLELSHQKNAILFQVEAETEDYLQPYLERYKRKPRYHLTKEKEMILVKEWDPKTYPEDVRGSWDQCS